jgi:hypothetical protein
MRHKGVQKNLIVGEHNWRDLQDMMVCKMFVTRLNEGPKQW